MKFNIKREKKKNFTKLWKSQLKSKFKLELK